MAYDEREIRFIQDRATERITEVLDALGVEYDERHDYIHGPCPVHEGDNPRAWYWAMRTVHWRCMTRQCQRDPVTGPSSSIFGLVRGVLAHKNGRACSFQQAIDFVVVALNLGQAKGGSYSVQDLEIERVLRRHRQRKVEHHGRVGVPLAEVLPNLTPDTVYYPRRGVSQRIIARYHVSYCDRPDKPFSDRAFFPVLDESGRYVVGYSARSVHEKCERCGLYHATKMACPPRERAGWYRKWRHSQGFRAERCLYNLWFARPFIFKTGVAIVCEGPGDVWAYEEAGIRNAVAMFGVSLSASQRKMLQRAGALTLVFTLDNDEAGQKARATLEEQLQYYFRLFFVAPTHKHDIGEMLPQDIRKHLAPTINGASRSRQLAR